MTRYRFLGWLVVFSNENIGGKSVGKFIFQVRFRNTWVASIEPTSFLGTAAECLDVTTKFSGHPRKTFLDIGLASFWVSFWALHEPKLFDTTTMSCCKGLPGWKTLNSFRKLLRDYIPSFDQYHFWGNRFFPSSPNFAPVENVQFGPALVARRNRL